MKKLKTQVTDKLEDRVQEFAGYLLQLRKVQDKSSAAFLESLGKLSMQELNVLNVIGDTEPCTMSAIAKQIALSLSSVTVIVEKLVKARLVKRTRDEEDRRVVYGSLTSEGKKIYQLQIEHMQTVIRMLFAVLTLEEQEKLLKIFSKFAQVLV